MAKQSEWQWLGHAGHLIVADRCLHHLCTKVGDYLVSTVGDYRPNGKQSEEIGLNRLYETFVFRIEPGECSCGCGLPNFVPSEIDAEGANDAKAANANHIAMCLKWSKRKPTP